MTEQDPTIEESAAYQRGMAKMQEIYADSVMALPEGVMAFNDVMMRSLFSEVWDRDTLSIRDRRLLIMGVIAARGAVDTWKIQAAASLANGELTVEELRETLVILAPYAGYPSVAPLVAETEGLIHRWSGSDSASEE